MEIEKATGYGKAMSDIEGGWDDAFKAKLKKKAQSIIMGNLSFFQKLQLVYLMQKEKNKAAHLDLSDLKARGMNNKSFLDQQLEYISIFSALKRIIGKDDALELMYKVMDATTAEAFSQNMPKPEEMESFESPMEFFRKYFAILPEVSLKAGCHEVSIPLDSPECTEFDIHWCVWYELAKKMNVPEACIPNCYADDLVYPEYFKSLGIKYTRSGTLANGAKCCDFRFEKI